MEMSRFEFGLSSTGTSIELVLSGSSAMTEEEEDIVRGWDNIRMQGVLKFVYNPITVIEICWISEENWSSKDYWREERVAKYWLIEDTEMRALSRPFLEGESEIPNLISLKSPSTL